MKSITFSINDLGKVIVFPNDPSGKGLKPEITFTRAELELVQTALFNIQHHPHLYDIAAIDFEASNVASEFTSAKLDLSDFVNKVKEEVRPMDSDTPIEILYEDKQAKK
jgi:hypothetical protein